MAKCSVRENVEKTVACGNSSPAYMRMSGSVTAEYRPRILHLLNHFELGGTERQAVLLLQHLDRSRYEVLLGALSTAGPLFEDVVPLFPHVEKYPLTSFYNVNALRQVLKLREFLINNRVDIMHTHEFYSGLLAVMAARFTGTRVIASQRHLRMSDRVVHYWGRRVLNSLADRVLVNAEAIRQQILSMTSIQSAKIVVVRNGLLRSGLEQDQESISCLFRKARKLLGDALGISNSSIIVGTVANLRPVKGHQYLIKAAADVIRTNANVHFVLVGEGELRSQLETQAESLGIRSHIHFMGHRTDAGSLVAGFDLAVLSSLHEGMPNTVLEAMDAGVPVVATAVGGVTEIIDDQETGFLVAPGDSGAMAKCLRFVLEQDHLRRRIGLQGRQSVREAFSVERMVTSVQHLYDDLLQCVDVRP